ncbi:hypothetical protein N0V90_000372 [Kalmusia sp. IMI 367209]|nr:hypothetical protein N0V90_000372 [Kalmusia sp. IMI 367209]
MTPDPEAIANCVLETFDQLPDKRKPRPRTDGAREWVPLAGIVLVDKGMPGPIHASRSVVSSYSSSSEDGNLSTGMKCLPSNKLPLANGNALHDWHAEVLALRALNRFLLDESTSLLSSMTSMLISPRNAYLRSLTIPSSQHVPAACERAFSRSGRMKGVTEDMAKQWQGGYTWHAFEVHSTHREFDWSRRAIRDGLKAAPSNLSAVWTPMWQETLIGGVLQGRKQFDPRGASAICRRSMWKVALQIASVAGVPTLSRALGKARYEEVKANEVLVDRRKVKEDVRREGLRGWAKNTGDDDFGLEA